MLTKLSTHQKRVLAALLELEAAYQWRWWSRDAIGYVVAAGGYHETLQIPTIAALKSGGLIQSERSSWPLEVQRLVRCNCGCHQWGLTNRGRTKARALNVLWDDAGRERIAKARWRNNHQELERLRDEDDARAELKRHLDEIRRADDDDDRDPADFWKNHP